MSTNITDATWITMVDKEQITTVDEGLLVLAPAKINLSLLIAGKRPDSRQASRRFPRNRNSNGQGGLIR
jgi:hypothetical protein